MTNFVKTFIETAGDGHDFYPYREQAELLGHAPEKSNIAAFVENMIEAKFETIMENDSDVVPVRVKATATQVMKAFRSNPAYREKAIAEAVEYIFDPDFAFDA